MSGQIVAIYVLGRVGCIQELRDASKRAVRHLVRPTGGLSLSGDMAWFVESGIILVRYGLSSRRVTYDTMSLSPPPRPLGGRDKVYTTLVHYVQVCRDGRRRRAILDMGTNTYTYTKTCSPSSKFSALCLWPLSNQPWLLNTAAAHNEQLSVTRPRTLPAWEVP